MAKSTTADMDFFEKVGYAFGLLSESWEAFKLNWSTFILIWILPMLLFLLLIPLFIIPVVFDNDIVSATTLLLGVVGVLSAFVVLIILIPAITVTQIASVKGQKLGFEEAFSQSKKYVWRYVLAAIIGFFITIGPMLLALPLVLIVIGLFLLPLALLWAVVAQFFLLLVPFIIVSEDVSATDAISRSYELTKKNWQWILAVYIVLLSLAIASNILSIIPFIGWVISLGLFLAYYCMPAHVYVNEVFVKDVPVQVPKSAKPAKKSANKKATKKK